MSAAHPLIAPGLASAWAYDAAWGCDDHHRDGGHGTALAGLALLGDLAPLMEDARQVALTHSVESMKLLPPGGFPHTEPGNYGVVTQGAVASVETARPQVRRTLCLACSTVDFPNDRPSSWSGSIDQIAAGSMPGDRNAAVHGSEHPKRLVLVPIGNVQGGCGRTWSAATRSRTRRRAGTRSPSAASRPRRAATTARSPPWCAVQPRL